MNIHDIAQNVGHALQRNSPAILTALGVSGVLATGWTAHMAGRKVTRDLWLWADENGEENLTAKIVVDLTWRHYIPPATIALTTCVAIIGAQTINHRRQAALFSAVSIGQRALDEYREKAREILGETKESEIRNEIAKDRVEAEPPEKSMVLFGGTKVLCMDMFSGRYFEAEIEVLRKAMNDINAECIQHNYASLNDFWSKVGLPALPVGETVGFTTDNMLELNIQYMGDEAGRPTAAIDFRKAPVTDYYSVWR